MADNMRRTGLSLAVDGAAEFQRSLGDINRELKQSQAELNKVAAAYGRNEQNIDTLTAKKRHLDNALRLNKEEQAALNRQLEEATEKYGANSREVEVLQTKLTNAEAKQAGLTRQLGEVTAALEAQERALRGQAWTEFGEKAEAAGKRLEAAGKRMTDVGKTMSMAVTAPIVAMGVASLAVGADFEQSMGTIQARTGMTREAVEELGQEFRAMALSGDYGTFTARQIAGAYAGIALAGHDATHATEVMRTSMVLATAVGNDLGATAYFLGAYLDKVGKDASYAEKYINLFAEANQRTNIGLHTLQDYLFRANASLQAANISGTEATAVFSQLYQAGINGANAYSGFSQAIQSIMLPSAAAREALKELGITNAEYYVEQGRVLELLFNVTKALGDVESSTKALNLMTTIFTQGSAQAFIDGLGDNRDALKEMIPALYEASSAIEGTGLAFEMAAIQQDGLVGSNQQIRASLEEIMLQISDHLLPHIQSFLGVVSEWINRFASLDESTQRTILKFAAFAAAIGPVLTVSGKFLTMTGKTTVAMGKLTKSIGAAGGAKSYLALKFPVLTAGYKTMTAATTTNTAALTANTGKLTIASSKMNLFATGMKTKAASMGLLTKGLTAATAGFIKLTAAMLANPVVLITAGVVALGVAIAGLIVKNNRVSESYRDVGTEVDRLIDRQTELAEAAASAAESFQANTQQLSKQAEHYRGLADSIEHLANKSELTAGDMALLEHQISELNNSVPGLSLAFNEQTGALNMTAEALQNYLNIAEKRSKITAQLEEHSRLQREAKQLEHEHMEVIKQREALEKQLNDGTNRRRADRRALEEAIQDLTEAEQGYMVALEANIGMQNAIAESIDAYSSALEALERAQYEAIQVIDDTTDAMERQIWTVEEWEKAQNEAINRLEQSYNRYYRVAANAFQTVSESAAVSVQDLTANLQKNARAVEEWSTNIAILTERGVDQGLIQQLRDAGPAAAATVRELVDASDKELDALNTAFEDSTRVALESMQRELDPSGVVQSAGELIDKVAESILNNQSMEDALVDQINAAFGGMDETISNIGFDGLGENTIEGYIQGIENRLPDVEAAGQDTGEAYSDALKSSLEQNSPSRVTGRIAVGAIDGFVQTTESEMHRVTSIAQTLALAFINNVSDTITNSQDINNSTRRQVEEMRQMADMAIMNANFESVGMEMANGVARGISNNGGMVSNAATNMINNALMAMRTAAEIRSPSRKSGKIADQIGDGLIIHMKAKGKELIEVCKNITIGVMDSLKFDTSGIIESSKNALYGLQNGLPALQTNVNQVGNPSLQTQATQSRYPQGVTININHPVIREENDIKKLAKAVKKVLSEDVDYETRIGGIAVQL